MERKRTYEGDNQFNKLAQLPDLGNAAKLLKISCQLEDITEQKGGMIAAAIQTGLRKRRVKEMVLMIRGMAIDNEKMIVDIIGKDLLEDIKSVKL